MTKKQVRIVLNDSALPIAERIKSVTRVSSLSDAVALILSKYGNSFCDWFESVPVSEPRVDNLPLPSVDLSVPMSELL